MNTRHFVVGMLLLLTCGFLAGRAFPQNDFPIDRNVEPQAVESRRAKSPDPFEIPMPPDVFRGTVESATTTHTTRGVTPMKYFVPVTKDGTPAGIDNLRERFSQVVAERAAIMSADELQTEITAIEKVLREFAARQALERSLKSLETVVSEYPETEAAKDARKAIELLQTRPLESRRSL